MKLDDITKMVKQVFEVNAAVKPHKIHRQIISCIIGCMPIMAYGTAMGWMSPMIPILQSDNTPYDLPASDDIVSWMASIMFIFAPLAVFFYGIAADRFGRKRMVIFTSVPIALGWAVKLLAPSPLWLIVARAFIGFGAGGAFVVSPLYVKELSDDAIRGTTGTFVIFSQTFGNLVMYILGDLLSFNVCIWICLFIPLLHILLSFNCPESPSYLVKKGMIEESAKALSWLKVLPEDDKVVLEAVEKLRSEQESITTKFLPKLLFSKGITRKAFFVALNVNLVREFCGAIAVLIYASVIFEKSNRNGQGITLSPNHQAIMVGAVQVMASLVASLLVDRVGRKPLLAITTVVAGSSMFLLATWFYLLEKDIFLPGWLPVTALCVCIFADASGLQPLPFVIITEMFSFQLRGTVATLIMSTSLALDFGIIRLFHMALATLGYHYTFWIFSVICFVNLFYLLLYVPETKKRSLEEIYKDLR